VGRLGLGESEGLGLVLVVSVLAAAVISLTYGSVTDCYGALTERFRTFTENIDYAHH